MSSELQIAHVASVRARFRPMLDLDVELPLLLLLREAKLCVRRMRGDMRGETADELGGLGKLNSVAVRSSTAPTWMTSLPLRLTSPCFRSSNRCSRSRFATSIA